MSKSEHLIQERIKRFREGKFVCDLEGLFQIAKVMLQERLEERAEERAPSDSEGDTGKAAPKSA